MPAEVAAAAEGPAESDVLIDHAGAPGLRMGWRRSLTGLAVATGAACLGSAAVLRRSNPMTTVEGLRKPFKLYDSNIPGCLPMPSRSNQYDGIEEKRPVKIEDDKNGVANVFVVGDWGATVNNHAPFGWQGQDWEAHVQEEVATAMNARSVWAKPQYILNVGDNFYVEGLELSCNAPPNDNPQVTAQSFSYVWQSVYGPMATLPWLSVLGNHDYGGWRFDKGWPQQIGYSFVNYNWIMPARYYMKRMKHSNFVADYFMIDSNNYDAKDYNDPNPNHNICSPHNNGGIGTCGNNGGPADIGGCKDWFWGSYAVQKQWLESKLNASDARWKVVVTHFPCGYDYGFYKDMKARHGLDLLVTGHRHQQELWKPQSNSKYVQSMMKASFWDGAAPACFVTGGGGGITSEMFGYADYGEDLLWYGFFHLTFAKDWMKIELVKPDNTVHGNWTIFPHGTPAAKKQAKEKLRDDLGLCADFCGDMNNGWDKVCPGGSAPFASCAGCKGCAPEKPNKTNATLAIKA